MKSLKSFSNFKAMWPYIMTHLDVRDVGHDYDWYDLLDFLPLLFVSFLFLSNGYFELRNELVVWLLNELQPIKNEEIVKKSTYFFVTKLDS